ncbi:unnamed protein product, partial [Polarella glacialis]
MERLTEAGDQSPSSSSSSSFFSQARLAFEYSLKNLLWKQAAFFAERLVAERPCDETTYLLALAYFHNQETARAQWHLRGNKLPDARYLLAKCCMQLSRWDQAEEALLGASAGAPGMPGNLSDFVNGAAGLFLLGQVQERQSRREQAVECYAKCLELCPFMWEAYERWSWLVLGLPSPSRSSTSSMAPSTFSDEKFVQSFASLSSSNQAQSGSTPTSRGPERSALTSPVARSSGTLRSQNAPPRNEQQIQLSKGLPARRDRREPVRQDKEIVPVAAGRRQTTAAPSAPEGPASGAGNAGGSEVSLAGLLCKLGIALH